MERRSERHLISLLWEDWGQSRSQGTRPDPPTEASGLQESAEDASRITHRATTAKCNDIRQTLGAGVMMDSFI
jgi:hypothetical protein